MTLPGASEARMLNTCSIGRRWKPREGWSRPVLTGERGTLFPTLVGRVSSCGGFFRWMARNAVSCGHGDDTGEAFLLASVVRFPDRHDRNRGVVPVPPVRWFPSDRCIGFAVVMAQVRRPVPFRTRKLRPGRGDGTALERVWESSTPPHSTYGPSGRAPSGFPEGPFLFPRTGVSSAHWRFRDAGRPVGGRIAPVSGGIGTTADSTRRGVSDD